MPRGRGKGGGAAGSDNGKAKAKGNVTMQSVVQVHPHHGMTAQRFAGKPLKQPKYAFRDVPKCERDLAGSRLYEVYRRDDFNDSMAEMVLLCNEVMRRRLCLCLLALLGSFFGLCGPPAMHKIRWSSQVVPRGRNKRRGEGY